MDKFSELKAVAEKAKELAGINNYKKGKDAIAAFKAAANPAAILALLADNEHLARELVARNGENEWLRKRAAELEAKDERIGELEAIATEYAGKFQKAQDANRHLVIMSNDDKKRIAELEAIKADASQVFKEIGNELGCNPDNESIMMAIDELKATQMTGPLKDVLKRNIELEAKLATPIKIVNYDEFFICHVSGASDDYCKGWVDGRNAAARDVGKAGFTVGDRQ
ncbi:TPA: hypothetical protein U2J86_005106 [Serratia marcescens]|nr:hypothetical protein [Serratia marcescens]